MSEQPEAPANNDHRPGSGEALLEALQEIARWSGNARVKWYVDQYALKLIAEAKQPTPSKGE